MKTPASTHGHLHGLSVSSQPSSTPLGAIAIHDELLNLNSPAAALINSIAQNNLTPLPAGQDGLGLTVQTPLSTRDGPKNPEAQRLHRLQQAVDQLKAKVAGRGITRAGIERVAKLHGFVVLWDDCNLVIAGEIVELEINFDKQTHDTIRDLSLKLNYEDGEHVQQAGTDMLKGQVGIQTDSARTPADDLCDFASNIEYLAGLDLIVQKPNCFQLVNNLSSCLHDIWKEEKKRMHWRNDLHHLRKAAVGRPVDDRTPSLGLSIDIWQKESVEPPSTDGGIKEASRAVIPKRKILWSAKISCETGSPSIVSTKDWVASNILTEGQPGQNPLDAQDHVYHPDWRESAAGLAIQAAETKDETSMDLDKKTTDLPQPLNVHFTCELDSEVLVPLPVLTKLNSEINMIDIDPRKAVTYHQTLKRKRNGGALQPTETLTEERWQRRLPYFDTKGCLTWHEQSFKLYSSSPEAELWCYPISKTKFNHPRQLAELLPILRMHIVVWALLESIVMTDMQQTKPEEVTKGEQNQKRKITRRSNKPQPGDGSAAGAATNVDVSIDYLSNPSKTAIDVFASPRTGTLAKGKDSMLYFVIQIGLNGVIEVSSLSGVHEKNSSSLKSKLGKMLTMTEDIGVVVQWLHARAE